MAVQIRRRGLAPVADSGYFESGRSKAAARDSRPDVVREEILEVIEEAIVAVERGLTAISDEDLEALALRLVCDLEGDASRRVDGVASVFATIFSEVGRSGQRAANVMTLIQSAKINDLDPQAYLREVFARIADHPVNRVDELLPWNLNIPSVTDQAAA